MRSKVLICSVLETLLAFENSTDITTAVMPDVTDWDTTNAARTTQKVITIGDEMKKINNHRGKFVSLCADQGRNFRDDDELCYKCVEIVKTLHVKFFP